MTSVPPKSLNVALEHVARGGRLLVATYTKATVISGKCLAKWEAYGKPFLTEEGDGYRMRQGKGSVYLVPGLLKMID